MLEAIHELLYAVVRLHLNLDTGGELSPNMLNNLGRFTEYVCHISRIPSDSSLCCRTLHKIHTFMEAQQEKSRIKQFFRQGELSTLLKVCNTGLDQALEAFKVCLSSRLYAKHSNWKLCRFRGFIS
jgi:hypothetical protein